MVQVLSLSRTMPTEGRTMDRIHAEQLISDLYKYALRRDPQEKEFGDWVGALESGLEPTTVVRSFYQSPEYQNKRAVSSVFPTGHYHSPVVDPDTVADYYEREIRSAPTDIEIDTGSMLKLWNDNRDFIKTTPFTDDPHPDNRYNYNGGPFPAGDGITLRMMINHFRPKRVVEIGSGYSSACMLDSVEHVGLSDFHLTCIEPDPARLKSILRKQDAGRVTILENLVQSVPASIVDQLEPNDILFIDSTHVLKTGSDVHYELFYLLPRLKPGVIVHFHDVPYPFEYPAKWVFDDNYSWNEAYMLRAFLMFNDTFKILFWGSLFAKAFKDQIYEDVPAFLRNTGASIWIDRTK
jgi:predicted O-methyltransferase YrrM